MLGLAVAGGVLAGWVLLIGSSDDQPVAGLDTVAVSAESGGVASAGAGGVVVEIPPGAVLGDGELSIVAGGDGSEPVVALADGLFDGVAVPVGHPYRIEVAGTELTGTIHIEMPYDPALLPADTDAGGLFAAYLDDATGTWIPVAAVVDTSRQVVIVDTGHLSWWQLWTWDLEAAVAWLHDQLVTVFEGTGTPVGNPPACPDDRPTAIEVSIVDDVVADPLLVACLQAGPSEDTATLGVFNNRAYGLWVSPQPDIQPISLQADRFLDAALVLLDERIGDPGFYLPGGGQAEFALSFTDTDIMTVGYASSDVTILFDLMTSVVTTILGGTLAEDIVDAYSLLECAYSALAGGGSAADFNDLWDTARTCLSGHIPLLGPLLAGIRFTTIATERFWDQIRTAADGQLTITHTSDTLEPIQAITEEPPTGSTLAWSRVPHNEAIFGGEGIQWMTSVTVGGPGLVAVGWELRGPTDFDAAVWTSPDGINWSRVPYNEAIFGGEGGQQMYSVTAGGPGLVAVGQEELVDAVFRAAVWTSPDGINWSRVPHNESIFGVEGAQAMYSVTAGGSGLVAVGVSISLSDVRAAWVWISSDGIRWSRVLANEAAPGGDRIRWMTSVTVGGPGLVGVGYEDSELVAAVWTSPDGINWSRVPHDEAAFAGRAMSSVTVGGPGLLVVGAEVPPGAGQPSDAAAVWTSPDGINWSLVPYDEAAFAGRLMSSVTVGGPGLVAVGADVSGRYPAVWTSPDGINWSLGTDDDLAFEGEMLSVTAGGPGLVAVGQDSSRNAAAVWVATAND